MIEFRASVWGLSAEPSQSAPLPPWGKKSTSELPYIEDLLPGQRLLRRFHEGLLHKPSQVNFFPTFEDPKSYLEVDFHSHTPRGSADFHSETP